jgi:hypothetical protein
VQEVVLHSRHPYGNPFTDVNVIGVFKSAGRIVKVDGFYDGDATWKLRLMASEPGTLSFKTISKDAELNGVAAGGDLEGESSARLAFLKSVMISLPFQDMVPSPELVVNATALAKPGEAYLFRIVWSGKDFVGQPRTQVRLGGQNSSRSNSSIPGA